MSPPTPSNRSARRTQWLLALPPLLPGALMLLAGWVRASSHAGDLAARSRALDQAGVLYVAGSIALVGGVLMSIYAGWKILRPTPLEAEDAEAP
jgi:hypothetical protein